MEFQYVWFLHLCDTERSPRLLVVLIFHNCGFYCKHINNIFFSLTQIYVPQSHLQYIETGPLGFATQ